MPGITYQYKLEGDALAYPLDRAAKLVGTTGNRLSREAKAGKLITFRLGGRVCVTRKALEAYLQRLEVDAAREETEAAREGVEV